MGSLGPPSTPTAALLLEVKRVPAGDDTEAIRKGCLPVAGKIQGKLRGSLAVEGLSIREKIKPGKHYAV